MFRKAKQADIDAIAAIYEKIHDAEERGELTIGWVRGVYPVRETALAALERDDLFVETDEAGTILASGIINQLQGPEYAHGPWSFEAEDQDVMVLHTLTVDPDRRGRGYGRAFAEFYEQTAREQGCRVLRIDSQMKNKRARALYARLGYREAGVVDCDFNGISAVKLVCMEKKI